MTPTESVLAALAHNGLLLKQDKAIPSVVGILTGESLSTSWWSHPKAQLIFNVLSRLADHPDVCVTKLIYRKDTLVHRSLWPTLLAVGRSREPWQVRGLSRLGRTLLRRVDRAGGPICASGEAVKQLQVRLLASTHELHTEAGRHEMALESWNLWSARVGCSATRSTPNAREILEQACLNLGATLKALPWNPPNTV